MKDPSKAFDCLPHELINTKLKTYGLPLLAFKLVSDYLINPKQSAKIVNSSSSWEDIQFGEPQGSGPNLTIFLSDFFPIIDDISFPATMMITSFTVQEAGLIT